MIPFEEKEQEWLCEFLDLTKLDYCAVPNGGHRHKRTAIAMKRTGVKAGVPDILIFSRPLHDPAVVGVAIELKRTKGGRVPKTQRDWHEKLRGHGWIVLVCRGAGHAIDCIKKIYKY